MKLKQNEIQTIELCFGPIDGLDDESGGVWTE